MKACKICTQLMKEDVCPVCKTPTTQYWTGFFGLIDPEKSEIAKSMELKVPGQFALKVR